MNIAWWFWFQKGGFFTQVHRSPLSGHLKNKSWSDTNTIKNGKSDYEERDNGWKDDTEWND